MSIVENPLTTADVAEWYRVKTEMARLKTCESLLRRKIVDALFPNPKEGANRISADAFMAVPGWDFVLEQGIDRKIDAAAISALADELASNLVSVDQLVKRTPELITTAYRRLNEDQKHLFDQCLIIKPASPQLKLVARPKKD